MKANPSGAQLVFEFMDVQTKSNMMELSRLVPDNTLCGLADVIPGVENDRLP